MYDGSATMLEFQLVAVSTLAGALLRAMQGHSIRLVITERSVGGNRTIFARPGLTAECLAAYDTVYASLMAALPPRDSYSFVRLHTASQPLWCSLRAYIRNS